MNVNTNPHLQWALTALLNPHSQFGAWLDPAMAQAAYSFLEERAQAFVFRRGIYDTHLGEEALHDLLVWAAQSEIAFKYRPERGTPRQFILMKLDKAVCLCIRKKFRRVVHLLDEDLESREINPALAVELSELHSVFAALSVDDEKTGGEDDAAGAAVPCAPDKPQTPGSAKVALTPKDYVRRHRARKLRWSRIKEHFPEIEGMRPRLRRPRGWTKRRPNTMHRRSRESSVRVRMD